MVRSRRGPWMKMNNLMKLLWDHHHHLQQKLPPAQNPQAHHTCTLPQQQQLMQNYLKYHPHHTASWSPSPWKSRRYHLHWRHLTCRSLRARNLSLHQRAKNPLLNNELELPGKRPFWLEGLSPMVVQLFNLPERLHTPRSHSPTMTRSSSPVRLTSFPTATCRWDGTMRTATWSWGRLRTSGALRETTSRGCTTWPGRRSSLQQRTTVLCLWDVWHANASPSWPMDKWSETNGPVGRLADNWLDRLGPVTHGSRSKHHTERTPRTSSRTRALALRPSTCRRTRPTLLWAKGLCLCRTDLPSRRPSRRS